MPKLNPGWWAIGLVAALVLLGGGFLGGYMAGRAGITVTVGVVASPSAEPTPSPTATATPSPTPTPTLSSPPLPAPACWFGDFPYYPGSLAVAASSPGGHAWHVYASGTQVATYFANGASQLAWRFTPFSQGSSRWIFLMTRQPACRGTLVVLTDPAGGALFEAVPDAQ